MLTDMRKLAIAFLGCLLLPLSAVAQTGMPKSTSVLTSEVNTLWPDNTAGAITPFNSRQTLLDIVSSYFNNIPTALSGSTSSTCTSGPVVNYPCINLFEILSDTMDASVPSDALDYWQFNSTFGGSALKGARQTLDVIANFTAASNASNTNKNYVAIVGATNAASADGGTGTTLLTGAGQITGINAVARANIFATNLLSVQGMESDVNIAGGSTAQRFGFNATSFPTVQGSTYDAAYIVQAASGTNNVGWINFLFLANTGGRAPLDATNGCVLCTDGTADTIKTGIDLSAYTISGNFLKGPNYSVTGGGFVNIGPNSISDSVPLSVVNQANAASVSPVTGAGFNLHVAGADANANQSVFDSFGGATTLISRRADGTAASRTGVVANDGLFVVQAEGWTSAAAYSGAAAVFGATATETWSSSANGTKFSIRTTKNTTTTLADAMVVDGFGHVQHGSIAPTSVSTCGTGSLTSNSTDAAGSAAATGATACTVNFANSYASAPTCVVSDNTTADGLKVATGTGSFTVTGLTSGDTFSWVCFGKVGL